MKPIVSVIIVSYNTRDLTVKSIKSVYTSSGFKPAELEVIVVDNHSSDDSVSYIRKHFPQVTVISNPSNRGFGGANNQGAKAAKGQYLLLLNSDAFLGPDSLRVMVDSLHTNQDLVSVGPQLRYQDQSLQLSGGYLPTPGRIMAWMWWLDKLPLVKKLFSTPYHVFDPEWHTQTQYSEWLMGACVMFRRDEFLAVSGFDEQIFMYAEEVELYRRLQARFHKRVLFTPTTSVVHLGGASSKKANAYRLVLELRGLEYIYHKHNPSLYPLIKFVIITGVVLRLAVFALIPSRREAVREYINYFKS